jgi:hypothetical protein
MEHLSKPKIVFDDESRQTLVIVPIVFANANFVYYGEDQAYLQFDTIRLQPSDEVEDAVLKEAARQFGHIFRCIDMSGWDDSGYYQISIRALHGDNLLDRLRGTDMEVSFES